PARGAAGGSEGVIGNGERYGVTVANQAGATADTINLQVAAAEHDVSAPEIEIRLAREGTGARAVYVRGASGRRHGYRDPVAACCLTDEPCRRSGTHRPAQPLRGEGYRRAGTGAAGERDRRHMAYRVRTGIGRDHGGG